MALLGQEPNLIATGNIAPSVFVVIDTANDFSVLQASSKTASPYIGVSQVGTDFPPGIGSTETNYAAVSGEELQIFSLGQICLLTAASPGWTRGDTLTCANSSGQGVTTTTAGNWVGAIALESAATGDLAVVQVVSFAHP